MVSDHIYEMRRLWAAGFMDGEACIRISPPKQGSKRIYGAYVRVSVKQVDPKPLEYLTRIFGGNIYKDKAGKNNLRDAWVWQVQGKAAIPVLWCIAQKGVAKVDQALLAMKAQAIIMRDGGTRCDLEDLVAKITHLKHRDDYPDAVVREQELPESCEQ